MLSVDISGQAELRKLASNIRDSGNKGLGREFAKALERVVDPIKQAISDEAAETMPSGYKDVLTRSLKHRRTTRSSAREATVRLATHGDGKVERRDLPTLNKGRLRHPLFGRRRTWYVTGIRPGFHDRAVEKAGPEAEKALLQVVDDYTARLTKG